MRLRPVHLALSGLGLLLTLAVLCMARWVSLPSAEPNPPSIGHLPHVNFSREFLHPVDVLDYLPLEVGTRWTYRRIRKDLMGPERVLITVRWVEEIEVVGHREVPQGKLILQETKIRDIECEHAPAARPKDVERCLRDAKERVGTHLLIRGNYVYTIGQTSVDLTSPEAPRIKHTVEDKQHIPLFFFPMEKVIAWAEPERELRMIEAAKLFDAGQGPGPSLYFCWHVAGKKNVIVPYDRIQGATLLEYRENTGTHYRWFKRGIGIIRETIGRYQNFHSVEVLLVDFEPARRRRSP